METTYSYFKRSLTKGDYDECLAKLKALGYNNSDAYMAWAWTIPGMYEGVIQDSTTLAISHEALEFYLQPLEFSSTLGLPRAIGQPEVAQLRVAATAWVNGGMKMNDATLAENVKEAIFNKSVNFEIACRSLVSRVDAEWKRIMWADIAAREHLSTAPVIKHLTDIVKMKDSLVNQGINAKICIHNMLTGCVNELFECPICC